MMTPEQGESADVERDDALLDAVAAGIPVDDPAAILLAEVAHAVEAPGVRRGSGEGGGGRRRRMIWGVTLGISVAIALGSGLSATASGQLPQRFEGAPRSGAVMPAVPSMSDGFDSITVTVPPASRRVTATGAAGTSAAAPRRFGGASVVDRSPWRLARQVVREPLYAPTPAYQPAVRRIAASDPMAPLAPTGAGAGAPRTYSRPVPTAAPAPTAAQAPAPSPVSRSSAYAAPRYSAPSSPSRQPYSGAAPGAAPMSPSSTSTTYAPYSSYAAPTGAGSPPSYGSFAPRPSGPSAGSGFRR